MNEKEISEIRRRFRPDRSGISHIRGCYVNENREIVSQFDQSLGLMSQEESEKAAGHPPAHPVRHPGQKPGGHHLLHPAGGGQRGAPAPHGPAGLLPGGRRGRAGPVPAGHLLPHPGGELSHPPGPRHLRRPLPGQRRGADGRRLRPGVLLHPVLHLPGEADQARPELLCL